MAMYQVTKYARYEIFNNAPEATVPHKSLYQAKEYVKEKKDD